MTETEYEGKYLIILRILRILRNPVSGGPNGHVIQQVYSEMLWLKNEDGRA